MSSSQDPKSAKSPKSSGSTQAKAASPEAGSAPPVMVPLTAEERREAGILPATHWTQQPVSFMALLFTVRDEHKLIYAFPV